MDVRARVRSWHAQARWDCDVIFKVICRGEWIVHFLEKKDPEIDEDRLRAQPCDQRLRKARKAAERTAP